MTESERTNKRLKRLISQQEDLLRQGLLFEEAVNLHKMRIAKIENAILREKRKLSKLGAK